MAFKDEIGIAFETIQKECGVVAAYLRKIDAQHPISLIVVPAKTSYEVEDNYGFKVGAVSTDFICVLPFEPKQGDQMVVGTSTYEVLDLGADGCWRWTDSYKTARRIHVREIE